MRTHLAVDGTNQIHLFWSVAKTECCRLLVDRIHKLVPLCGPEFNGVTVVFDGERSFRHDLLTTYKASRKPKDPDLLACLLDAPNRLEDAGFSVVRCDHETVASGQPEADDILASLAWLAASRGERCMLLTGDKDCFGCLRAGLVNVCRNFDKGRPTWMTEELLRLAADHGGDYGLAPDRWVDYQSLVGGKNDVAGADGIGHATAVKILSRLSLDDAYRMIDDCPDAAAGPLGITKRQAGLLVAFRDRWPVVREAVRLRTDWRPAGDVAGEAKAEIDWGL